MTNTELLDLLREAREALKQKITFAIEMLEAKGGK